MTKNPLYNALFAIAYIVCLVSIIFYGPFSGPDNNILRPMAYLSIFVLSASLMVYLFFYQPVLMLLDGEREKGVKLFLKTVGIFAIGAAALLLIGSIFN